MNVNQYREFQWANQYTDAVRRVITSMAGKIVVIKIAPPQMDMREATDMIVSATFGTMGVRIRRPRFYGKYRDWTIRAIGTSGNPTELDKMRSGFCDWYLYAWANGDIPTGDFFDWFIVNVNIARSSGVLSVERKLYKNGDGTGFIAIPFDELKLAGCIVADRISDA